MLLPLIAALSLAAVPPKPFTLGPSIEGVTEYRLPNGMKVLLVPDSSKPSTTVNLTVFVGSRHENYGEKGMAHLFEHMLFKKTKKFASIKAELTKLGGMANGTTWYDRTNYYESFPAEDAKLAKALELEAERLRSAIISRDELATEMTVVRNEFEMGENQPEMVLMDRVMSTAFTWHNYGDSTIGPKSDIEKVPNERLLAFYETYYQPDNAMLVIAGKFDETKALQQVATLFGKMPKPKRVLPTTYTDEPTQDGEINLSVRRVGGTPVLTVGYHTPAASDPDTAAVEVLAGLLGDAPSGRLYKALVDGKQAAKVDCPGFALKQPLKESGYFLCTAMLQPKDSPQAAKDTLINTIEGLAKKPPTKEEVERAKTTLLKEFELLLSASDDVGIFLSEYGAAGDWRLLYLARDRVAAVTPEDVVRVAAKYFKQTNRVLGEYVPTAQPERSEIPLAAANLDAMLKDYKGKELMAQGEVFDASPKNIDTRTVKQTLANGTKVAVVAKKTRGETVRIAIALKYGNEQNLQGQRAAAELTSKLILRGTKTKTREQVKDALDRLKADVKVRQGRQTVGVLIEAHKKELNEVLAIVAESLKEPALDPKEFESLKRELVADAEQKKDDPSAIGFRGVQRMLSPFTKGHALYLPTWEEIIAEANATKLEQVKDFHARFYGAQAAQIAVVGDCDSKEVIEKLTQHFGSWKAKEAYTRILLPFPTAEPKPAAIETPDKAMAFYGTGTLFKLKDSDADYPALMLADYMLGGGFLNGRVPQRLREKEGLSYGAGTFTAVSPFDEPATMIGYAIYAPQNVTKIETGFAEEIAKAVTGGFSDQELKLAKEGLIKEREQQRAQDEALATELLEKLDVDRSMAFEQQIEDKLKALTAAEVGAALKRYIDPKRFSVLKVGDFKKKN